MRNMHITKCDICHKQIKNRESEITVSAGFWDNHSFCFSCGKSILLFLKKKGFLKDKKEKTK